MNWVDLAILAVLLVSGLLAFMRGLVREVLGLGAWVVAAIVASPYGLFPLVQPWTRQQFTDPTTADIVSVGGVFIITLVLLWIIAGLLANLIRDSVLGGLDRTLGLVFGLARGAVLVAVAYILVGMTVSIDTWPAPVLDARALPIVHHGADWLANQLPAQYRPLVATPPTSRPTTSASLLQSTPIGRANAAPRPRD